MTHHERRRQLVLRTQRPHWYRADSQWRVLRPLWPKGEKQPHPERSA